MLAYVDVAVVVATVVAAVVGAAAVDVVDVAFVVASAVVVADGLVCDNVAYSADDIFYRYRRRNFSKSHLRLMSCSACSEWRICRCLVHAYE